MDSNKMMKNTELPIENVKIKTTITVVDRWAFPTEKEFSPKTVDKKIGDSNYIDNPFSTNRFSEPSGPTGFSGPTGPSGAFGAAYGIGNITNGHFDSSPAGKGKSYQNEKSCVFAANAIIGVELTDTRYNIDYEKEIIETLKKEIFDAISRKLFFKIEKHLIDNKRVSIKVSLDVKVPIDYGDTMFASI